MPSAWTPTTRIPAPPPPKPCRLLPSLQKKCRPTLPCRNPTKTATGFPATRLSQALRWEVEALAKAGTLSIIGVYPPTQEAFPIGVAMNKNITVRMGNCNHRKYIPLLVDMVREGRVDPLLVLTE